MTGCHGYSDVMVNLLVNATNISPPSQQYQGGEGRGGGGRETSSPQARRSGLIVEYKKQDDSLK